jgi:hypothetical protein
MSIHDTKHVPKFKVIVKQCKLILIEHFYQFHSIVLHSHMYLWMFPKSADRHNCIWSALKPITNMQTIFMITSACKRDKL